MAAVRDEEGVKAHPVRRLLSAAGVAILVGALATVALPPRPAGAASIYCSTSREARQVVELVHGFHSGPDTWGKPARSQLAAAGSATCVDVFDYAKYSTYWVTNPNIGPALAARLDTMAAASKAGGGTGKVIVVAHSMGGLATRCAAAASCNGGRSQVVGHLAELITFGTPSAGSYLVNAAIGTAGSLLSASCHVHIAAAPAAALVCPQIQALTTSDAARAFATGSAELSKLPKLPATIPVYSLAGQVELHSSFFGFNDVDLGDVGDTIVLEASAVAMARKIGPIGGRQVINCGKIDITDFLRSAHSCWHSTETNDTRFLQAAAHQIALVEANTSAAAPTDAASLLAYIRAGRITPDSQFKFTADGAGQPLHSMPSYVSDSRTLVTPSGNIACTINPSHSQDQNELVCQAQQWRWANPHPKPCEHTGFQPNFLSVRPSGGAVLGGCYGGEPYSIYGATLPYGATVLYRDYGCRSGADFLACAYLPSGAGFTVDRDSYHLITGPAGRASLDPFVGTWSGHDRGAQVSASGVLTERIGSGCCSPAIYLTIQLSQPHLQGAVPTAMGTVTAVRTDPGWAQTSGMPLPVVGAVGTVTVDNDVLAESIFPSTYCGPVASGQRICGA